MARWTLLLAGIAFLGGGIGALLLLLLRRYGATALRRSSFLRLYVELFQGTPLLLWVQLFLVFFGLLLLGVDVSPLLAASLALDVLCQRLSGGDLARLCRRDPARPVGCKRQRSASVFSRRCAM